MVNDTAGTKRFDVKGDYLMGRSTAETDRLMTQAAILEPITRRLLDRAGLRSGMRVLDVGCGAGDVSLLAGEMVGPGGAVLGIDHNASVLATARERAGSMGLRHVEFHEHSVASFSDRDGFDVVVGRYVLAHQDDPPSFLKNIGCFVRAGGTLALHEFSPRAGLYSAPAVQLYDDVCDAIVGAFKAVTPHHDAADRFVSHFHKAELPEPALSSEVPVGGGLRSPFYAWLAGVFRSVQPVVEKHGLWRHGTMPGNDLESELRAAAVRIHSQVRMPEQICAWVRL
jgi:ubiquinone/menaquinone biosynthesis C-methylase UbiE